MKRIRAPSCNPGKLSFSLQIPQLLGFSSLLPGHLVITSIVVLMMLGCNYLFTSLSLSLNCEIIGVRSHLTEKAVIFDCPVPGLPYVHNKCLLSKSELSQTGIGFWEHRQTRRRPVWWPGWREAWTLALTSLCRWVCGGASWTWAALRPRQPVRTQKGERGGSDI